MVVSRDMRASSLPLIQSLSDGLRAAGLDVTDIGLATTPMNYFAIGHLGSSGGIQVTASHNPASYNGFKFSRRNAVPVSGDTGISRIEALVRESPVVPVSAPGRNRATRHPACLSRARASLRQRAGAAIEGRRRRCKRNGHALSRSARRTQHRNRAALLRPRRDLPQPRGEPAETREPARPPARRARRGVFARDCVRRRRGPRDLRRQRGAGRRSGPDHRLARGPDSGPLPGHADRLRHQVVMGYPRGDSGGWRASRSGRG